jgi:hypothetical protein
MGRPLFGINGEVSHPHHARLRFWRAECMLGPGRGLDTDDEFWRPLPAFDAFTIGRRCTAARQLSFPNTSSDLSGPPPGERTPDPVLVLRSAARRSAQGDSKRQNGAGPKNVIACRMRLSMPCALSRSGTKGKRKVREREISSFLSNRLSFGGSHGQR